MTSFSFFFDNFWPPPLIVTPFITNDLVLSSQNPWFSSPKSMTFYGRRPLCNFIVGIIKWKLNNLIPLFCCLFYIRPLLFCRTPRKIVQKRISMRMTLGERTITLVAISKSGTKTSWRNPPFLTQSRICLKSKPQQRNLVMFYVSLCNLILIFRIY